VRNWNGSEVYEWSITIEMSLFYRQMFNENLDVPPGRPMPGFRPLSRAPTVSGPRDRVQEIVNRNELDTVPLADLIRKNFGQKPGRTAANKEGSGDEGDELLGDTNFEHAGVST
jgi:hypothetical protein